MGLLRRVMSVSPSGAQVVVVTTLGTLADAFERLSFDISGQLAMPAVGNGGANVTSGRRKYAAVSSHFPGANDSPDNTCEVGVGPTFKEPVDLGASPYFLTGNVQVCLYFTMQLDMVGNGFLGLVPHVNSFSAKAQGAGSADLKLTAGAAGSKDTGHLPLGPPIRLPN